MTLSFGRLISPDAASGAAPVELPGSSPSALPRAHVHPAAVVHASEQAQRIVADAQARSRALLAEAHEEAQGVRDAARREGRAEGAAELAASLFAFRAEEARADERALDRLLALSRLLAERLLGEELVVGPERISALAKTALAEARGARRIHILAHPADTLALAALLESGELAGVTRVTPDATRARGSLRLETEMGVLDGELAPQLERLALRLRESLTHGR